MTTLRNEISIHAPMEHIWEALSRVENLEKFDPTVKSSVALTSLQSGMGASRKVNMRDGKNWFEEKVVEFKPHESLVYQLTDCSFPIKGLKHSYSFEQAGTDVMVRQVMQYTVKFGLLGKVMDRLMIRKQTNSGILKFFDGLKAYAEQGGNEG